MSQVQYHQCDVRAPLLGLDERNELRHHCTVTTHRDAAAIRATTDSETVEVRLTDFDAFYRRHRKEIGAALGYTLGSSTLGEEAVDEAMARAYQRWSSVSQYDSPAGWVYRAGLNWGRSWQRSMFRRKRREELVARSASDTIELRSERPELMEALSELSVDQRAVVVLRYYCDWSVSDTAAVLDITEGTVKSRSARALEQLRGVLGPGSEGRLA